MAYTANQIHQKGRIEKVIDRQLNQVTKQLIDLSNTTFFVNPNINRLIGKLKSSISNTISYLLAACLYFIIFALYELKSYPIKIQSTAQYSKKRNLQIYSFLLVVLLLINIKILKKEAMNLKN